MQRNPQALKAMMTASEAMTQLLVIDFGNGYRR